MPLINKSADTKGFIPIEENKLYFLFKRGKQEHIQSLYEKGEVYINSIDFIRNCDNNQERSDNDDGIMERSFLGDGKVTICDVGQDIDKKGITLDSINMTLTTDHKQKGNIFCLTGIYSEHLSGDRKNIIFNTRSFGETLIFIYNPREFLKRISKALQREGFPNFKANKVSYYENNYSGAVGFFRKHERFKSQSEFRIFIPNPRNESIKLKIGSLKDIAKLNKGLIKLTYTDNKEQLITL